MFTSYHERGEKSIENQEKPKRKTHTSTDVKRRYNEKVYAQYTISIRKSEDPEIVEAIEAAKSAGISANEAVKQLLRAGLANK